MKKTMPLPMLLLVAATACGPAIEGPQLREPPEGLGYTDAYQAARKVFRERPVVRQLGYVDPLAGEAWPGDVVITEFRGVATFEEIAAAREDRASRYPTEEYGPIEEIEIAGRPAQGWFEVQRYEEQEYPEYVAVVP